MSTSVDRPFGLAAVASSRSEGAMPAARSGVRTSESSTRPGPRTSERHTSGGRSPHPDRFEDRFDDLAAIAFRVTFRLLGSRQDAEDLTQETLTRAYRGWRKVGGHAEPWVARVAANLALDAIRRGKRRPTTNDSNGDDRPAPEGASVVDRLVLIRCLRELPRRQREVVVLRYLADMPEADVALELGISVGAVKRHASRGLAALRAQHDLATVQEDLSDPAPPTARLQSKGEK